MADSASRPPYVSSCLLDGVATTAWTDLSVVRALLAPWAEPAAAAKSPRGKHPLLIEAWRVRAGRWESPSGDQHAWAERAGRWTGGALGAGLGSLLGAAWFPGTGVVEGARLGAGTFGELTRRWSEAVAEAAGGAYNEVILSVPAKLKTGDDGQTHAFVVAMYTDSPVALWGDLAMRCGYRKRLATIRRPTPRQCRVESLEGEAVLSIDWSEDGGTQVAPGALAERTSPPLLGGLEGPRYAVSFMERSFEAAGARAAAVRARVSLAARAVDGLPPLEASTGSLTRRNRWGAFRFEGVPTILTYPRHGSA